FAQPTLQRDSRASPVPPNPSPQLAEVNSSHLSSSTYTPLLLESRFPSAFSRITQHCLRLIFPSLAQNSCHPAARTEAQVVICERGMSAKEGWEQRGAISIGL